MNENSQRTKEAVSLWYCESACPMLRPLGVKLSNLHCQKLSLTLSLSVSLSMIVTLISSKNPQWASSEKWLKNQLVESGYSYVNCKLICKLHQYSYVNFVESIGCRFDLTIEYLWRAVWSLSLLQVAKPRVV